MTFYSLVSNEEEKYKIYFAIYSDINEKRNRGVQFNVNQFFTKLCLGNQGVDRHLSHVDVVLNNIAYGPRQCDYISGIHLKHLPNDRTYIRIDVDEEDYRNTLKFVKEQERQRIPFDYCCIFNFIRCCPCYYYPINWGSDYCGPFKRWFCSNFAATIVKRLKKVKNLNIERIYNERTKAILKLPTCQIDPGTFIYLLDGINGIKQDSITYTEEDLRMMDKIEKEIDVIEY
jgi:hypothetical protein